MLKKIILTITLLVCFVIVGIFFSLDDMCSNDILKNIPSPNKQLQAIIFQRDCGTTTGFNRQIAIIPFNKSFNADNSGFFVMDNKQGNLDVNVFWNSNAELEIQYPKLARIFRAEKNTNGVTIVYRTYHE